MRTALLIPLALAAATAWGCGAGSDGSGSAAFRVPQRDLTLQESGAAGVEVASPVELANTPVRQATTRHPRRTQRPAVLPTSDAVASGNAAAPSPLVSAAPPAKLTVAAANAAEPADPHALAPGRTVTIIPASSGPATDGNWTDQRPCDAGGEGISLSPDGHGGGSKPHGGGRGPRGIGDGTFR
jgi:hypothetical protein